MFLPSSQQAALPRRPFRWFAARLGPSLLASFLAAVALAGCPGGPGRSAAAFCSTLAQEKERFLGTYNPKQGDDPLIGLVKGVASLGDIPIIFERLSRVSPEEIEPDVEAVRDAFKKQLDTAGGMASNPLASLVSSLFVSITSAGPFSRVEAYAAANC